MEAKSFLERAGKIHSNFYNYDIQKDNVNSDEKINAYCPIHGLFKPIVRNHLRGAICKKCSMEIVKQKTSCGTEKFIQKAIEVHGDKYMYDKVDYINSKTKVKISCKKHGDFMQTPSDHLSRCGCPKCGYECVGKLQLKNTNWFISRSIDIHGDTYDYTISKYINIVTKLDIICPIHGCFTRTPNEHINKKRGCPKCRNSSGETKIRYLLSNLNIKFSQEHRIRYNNKNFYYDFFIKDSAIAIEFDGQQHFQPVRFNGMNISDAKRNYRRILKRDILKKEYSINNNINLVRIPYYMANELEDIITSLFL